MKTKISILSLLASGMLFTTSCKKDDVDAPIVTITGNNMTVSLQGTFTDPGATANDDKDGAITPVVSGVVNTNLTGDYILTYSAVDAAGNTGTATRKVMVVNDAADMNGTYNVAGTPGAYSYVQTITASTTLNRRITFGKLGNYTNNSGIYADVVGTNITLPSQTAVGVGNPAANRAFSGTGTKNATGLTLTYTETTNGQAATYTEIMVKQ